MNQPSLPREQHVRSDSRTFRKRAQLNGQGTDGDLPIATMSTTSMAVNKLNHKTLYSNKPFFDIAENQDRILFASC